MDNEPFIGSKSIAAIPRVLPYLQYETPVHRIGKEIGLAAKTIKNILAFIEWHRIESEADIERVKHLRWRRRYHISKTPVAPKPFCPRQPLQAKRRVRPRAVSP
jgi:hypothetical protein